MKKIVLFILILSWIVLYGSLVAGWQKGGPFPGAVPFSPGFLSGRLFFFGSPDWGISPSFPGYYPYYPYYYPPDDVYKPKYESPYPQEIKTAGRLAIQVVPGDAEVLLNGQPLGNYEIGGIFDIGLLTGKYTLEARREGYREFEQSQE